MIKKLKVSPLAPKIFPKLPNIEGLKISTTTIDPKISKRHNLLLILSEEKSIFAGVFTKSSTASYSIVWSKKCLYKNLLNNIVPMAYFSLFVYSISLAFLQLETLGFLITLNMFKQLELIILIKVCF